MIRLGIAVKRQEETVDQQEKTARITDPDVIERANGGWLTVSGEGSRFRIGVVGETR